MGTGYHGGFGQTHGAAAGDAVFHSEPGQFFTNIARRSDVDKDGVYDVVAHGGTAIIQITHSGKPLAIDSRTAARLIQSKGEYKRGQPILIYT